MSLYLGIDLGSTTTKAVLMDDDGHVIGRGLTNTRSNYDAAATVARAEAVIDARFGLLGRELSAEALKALEMAFRVEQSVARFGLLKARMLEVAANAGDRAFVGNVERLLNELGADPDALFGELALDRTRFFRDIVGARWHRAIELGAAKKEIDFGLAQGVYDRSILDVENLIAERPFEEVLEAAVVRTKLTGDVRARAEAVVKAEKSRKLEIRNMVGTGYGRQRLPFAKEQIRSEILCHGLGAHSLFPNTRTVLDIGGQDTKAIQVDEHGIVTSFQMNDRCAAGCGRYLGYIADEMNLALHELGPLAMNATRGVKITSTCTVFAGMELRDLLSVGERRENILLGLHRAIMLRAMSLLARSGGVREELTFTGGVAKNAAAVKALRELVQRNYGDKTINIHPDSIYTGAIGGALFALRAVREPAAPEIALPQVAKQKPQAEA